MKIFLKVKISGGRQCLILIYLVKTEPVQNPGSAHFIATLSAVERDCPSCEHGKAHSGFPATLSAMETDCPSREHGKAHSCFHTLPLQPKALHPLPSLVYKHFLLAIQGAIYNEHTSALATKVCPFVRCYVSCNSETQVGRRR